MPSQTLSGITVLDLTSYIAGPFGASLLGDLGANVIKVEGPSGDMMRNYPSTLVGESRAYVGVNRNKRGIVIDLKSKDGLEVIRRLIKKSDVIVHNFRPGVSRRLGLEYEQLIDINPKIIYCGLTGFGETGPMASNPGFDQVLQSLTGISQAQGALENKPHVVWGSVVDYYSSSLLAMAVCAALYEREKTGKGQKINASLLRSALAMQSGRLVWGQNEDRNIERDLKGGKINSIHPAKEGFIYLQAPTEDFWKSLCELIGLSSLSQDPRYDSMKKRKENEEILLPMLHAALQKKTALEWEQHFGDRVPCSAVRSIEDMFDHPQVLSQGLISTHAHPTLGSYQTMTGPVQMANGESDLADRRAPMLGEHTDEILKEFDFSDLEISAFKKSQAIH